MTDKPVEEQTLNEHCAEFIKVMGGENWGPAQLNSMQSAFYSGALVSFLMFSKISDQANEDIAVTQIENLYLSIQANIEAQQEMMQIIWDSHNAS